LVNKIFSINFRFLNTQGRWVASGNPAKILPTAMRGGSENEPTNRHQHGEGPATKNESPAGFDTPDIER
jgi:hypothetical protein